MTDWRSAALCRNEDPELFFPVGDTGPAALQIEEAKAICAICPVRTECADWADQHNIGDGIWGGLLPKQRSLRRRRRREQEVRAARSKA